MDEDIPEEFRGAYWRGKPVEDLTRADLWEMIQSYKLQCDDKSRDLGMMFEISNARTRRA